jgi:hypothetical protein
MTDPQVAMLMMVSFIFLILLGFPIAFTLIAMGVGFGYYAYATPDQWEHIFNNRIFDLLVNQTYSVMTNDVLVAVPLFLLMGYVVERANIIDRLFYSLNIAARRVPGAMAVAALMTCAVFATAVGIVGAVGRLRHRVVCRRHLCRGMPGHSHSAEHHADRLRGGVRRLRGEAVRRRVSAWVLAGRSLHPLRGGARDPESQPGTEAAEGAVGYPVLGAGLYGRDRFRAAGRPDHGCAGCDPVRFGDAVGGSGGRRLRQPGPRCELSRTHLGSPERGGVPHGAHLGYGVLAVRRLLDLLVGFFLSRRP